VTTHSSNLHDILLPHPPPLQQRGRKLTWESLAPSDFVDARLDGEL
jgi:hypothetical protein